MNGWDDLLSVQIIWKLSWWSGYCRSRWSERRPDDLKVSGRSEKCPENQKGVWMICNVSGWSEKCPDELKSVRKILLSEKFCFFYSEQVPVSAQKSHFLSLQNGSGGLGSREFWSRVSFPGSLFLGSVVQSSMVVWSRVTCSSYAFSIIWLWSNHHRFQCWHPDYSIFLEFRLYIVKLINHVLVPRLWLASLLS